MNEENPILENEGLVLNDKVKSDLIQTAQSAKKMFVAFCISFVNLIFLSKYYLTKGEYFAAFPDDAQRMPNIMAAVSCIVAIAILIYPAIKLLQFSNATEKACQTDSTSEAEQGFARLLSFLRFNGVLSIVLCALPLLFVIIAGISFGVEELVHRLCFD